MSSYFEHYAAVNRLEEAGRRSHWAHFDRSIARWLPERRDAPILDVGCGAGIALEWLRARGWTAARGVDVDPGQVAFARGLGLRVEHAEDVAAWLDGCGPAAFVLLKDVLEHVPDAGVEPLLAAIARRLAPGGVLYLVVPNASSSFAARMRYIDPTHHRCYTEPSLRWVLARAGLRLRAIRSDDVWVPSTPLQAAKMPVKAVFRAIRRLEALAEFGWDGARMPLSPNLVAIAVPQEHADG